MAIAAGVGVAAAVGKAGFDLVMNAIDEEKAAIILDNGTNFTFTHLQTVAHSGKIKEQLPPTLSKGRYIMTSNGGRQTYGMVSLLLDGTDLALAVIWCVPSLQFLPFSSRNRMAIGFYNPGILQNPKEILTFVKKNKLPPPSFLRFALEEFKDNIRTIELDYVVKVSANMNNDKPGRVIVQLSESTEVLKQPHTLQDFKNVRIRDGQSLRCKTIDDLLYEARFRVVGLIEIKNDTNKKLIKPRIRLDGGQISVYPQDVEPFTREAVVVHKFPGTATGSYGTLSFYTEELDCRIVLMWSLPFNHDFYSNCLALDIRRGRELDHSDLFDKMYNGKNVVRSKYDKEFGDTFISRHGVNLTASMEPTHKSHIQLKVEVERAQWYI